MRSGERRLRVITVNVGDSRGYNNRKDTIGRLATGKVDIACIQETHDLDAHGEIIGDYAIYATHAGTHATVNNNTGGICGVSLIIRAPPLRNITEIRKINERLMCVRPEISTTNKKTPSSLTPMRQKWDMVQQDGEYTGEIYVTRYRLQQQETAISG